MTANEKGSSETGTATLFLKLSQAKTDGIKFKKAYYSIDYPKDAKADQVVDFSELDFNGYTDADKISVTVEDSKFIEISLKSLLYFVISYVQYF